MINNCAAHLKPMHLEKKSLTVMSRGTEIKNPTPDGANLSGVEVA